LFWRTFIIHSLVPVGIHIMWNKYTVTPPRLGWPLWNSCVTNDHGYVPLVLNTSRSFPRSWFITGFVTRLTRRVSLVEQELLIFPEHLSSPRVLSWVPVTCLLECMKNMEAEEYEKIFSYLSDGSYSKGKDFLFIYHY
jgi:hypothetical protein